MNTYRSGFADLIQAFVDYRNASGMSSEQCSFFSLRAFDKYCADNYPPETPLIQEFGPFEHLSNFFRSAI